MKKFLAIILITISLTGCELPGSGSGYVSNPTITDEEMATRVAQMLTSMPTATVDQNLLPTDTPTVFETLLPSQTSTAIFTPTSTLIPTETLLPESPTPTETIFTIFTATPNFTHTPTPTFVSTATVVPSPTENLDDPRRKLGTASWSDTLDNANNWAIDEDDYSAARIENGTMVVTGKQRMNAWRLAITQPNTNVYIEALMSNDNCAANDSYGVMFRVPSAIEANQGYLFGITCSGNYYVKMWDGREKPAGKLTTFIPNTPSDIINKGANQMNRIGVMAIGDHYYFYINGVLHKDYIDNTYINGYFGVFVKPSSTVPFSTRVDEVSYWLNPLSP